MTANDNKSDPSYLNQLVDEYNNTDHCSSVKKPVDADYSVLTEKYETNAKAHEFIVGDRVITTKQKISLKIGQEKYLLLTLSLKLIHERIKLDI